MGYGRARVHRCPTLVRPARQQGGVQVLRPCLGSRQLHHGLWCPQELSDHHYITGHTPEEAKELGVSIHRSRVGLSAAAGALEAQVWMLNRPGMQLLGAIRSPTSLSWTPIHFGLGPACIRLGPTTTRGYAASNRPRVPPPPGRTVIRSPARHEQGPTPRRNTHGSTNKGQYILLYDRCGRRGALVAGRTLLHGERAYRPLSRPSLLLLAWKRVIRARGGLDPQRPSSRPPSALGWTTSDEWAHGRSTSTARAPRRQRRPRMPTHPHQACAPWSICSLPITGDCASSVSDGEHACSRHRRVNGAVQGQALSRPGTFYSAGSENSTETQRIRHRTTRDNRTHSTHTRSSCKCT